MIGRAIRARIGSDQACEREEHLLDQSLELDRFLAGVERRAFHTARLATGNRDEALDIVQDAMFKLAQKYARRPAEEWGPLFNRILHSRINDWYRRGSVRARLRGWLGGTGNGDGEDPLQQAADGQGLDPEQQVQSDRAMDRLEAALGELSVRQRQAFLLRTWDGLDVRQTARAMSCSEGSVKTHYSRAVHLLRELMGEHWP